MKTPSNATTIDSEAMLQELMDSSFELPMLPETTSKLLQLCNDPDVEPSRLADCIRRDASIAGHVLQLSNSPLYGVGTQIASLNQAVARLGIKRLREIVLVVSCRERVFDVPEFETEVRESFRESFAAAVVSQEIARVRRLSVEDAFLCGLLHDVGRPVLFQAAVDFQQSNSVDFRRDDLLRVVDQNQASVGGTLIQKWGLPDRIADTVARQAEAECESATTETKLLSLARSLTGILRGTSESTLDDIRQLSIVAQLNLYPDDVESILQTSEDLLSTMGS